MSDTKSAEHVESSGASVSAVNSISTRSIELVNRANSANKFGVSGAVVMGDFVVGVSVGASVVGMRVSGLSVGDSVVALSVGDPEPTGPATGLTVGCEGEELLTIFNTLVSKLGARMFMTAAQEPWCAPIGRFP